MSLVTHFSPEKLIFWWCTVTKMSKWAPLFNKICIGKKNNPENSVWAVMLGSHRGIIKKIWQLLRRKCLSGTLLWTGAFWLILTFEKIGGLWEAEGGVKTFWKGSKWVSKNLIGLLGVCQRSGMLKNQFFDPPRLILHCHPKMGARGRQTALICPVKG